MTSRRARSAPAAEEAARSDWLKHLPLLLPAAHGGFGGREFLGGGLLGHTRGFETRAHFGQRRFEFRGQLPVAHAVQVGVLHALRDLLEFLALARADFARVVDRLLGAGDLGADLVITTLHLGQHGGLRVVLLSRALDGGLDRTLLGDGRLQGQVALVHDRLARAGFGLDLAQLQREQFGVRLPLFLLQRLVTARRGGLALQVAQLLFDFVTQVAETRQILAGLRDAALGLLALFLVARDARGFLEERAHVVGLGFDHARDHVLLDDRVAARTEPGAEEQLRDVLAAAAHAVQEIRRAAIARDEALQRNLGITRVLAAELAVAVVEHEFDRGRAHGLARTRAVENDVGHRVAAQVLGRDLAHDPAHGVDDVRLAAAVRARRRRPGSSGSRRSSDPRTT